MNDVALRIEGLRRAFRSGEAELVVLDSVDLSLRRGEIVGLVGPSGSGKSSLLHAAGLLERPSGGKVFLDGEEAWALDDDRRTTLRRSSIGFVYQFHHLLPEFNARDNVALPQLIAGAPRAIAQAEADRLLTRMGLAQRLTHQPAQLSGGEQQRVAIARALANKPRVLLADEPTGNLDPGTGEHVFATLAALVRQSGLAALVATHNLELAARMDRRITLRGGQIVPMA